MQFSSHRLLQTLSVLPPSTRYYVAYSGGADSHILLHALVQLRGQLPGIEIRALHVDHGLHASSSDWAQHCVGVCAGLDVACDVRQVNAHAQSGESPEDAARNARYAAFAEIMPAGEMLLTAHHQDDQAETLLLQLLRGAGPRGLAGMAKISRYGTAWLARPLLDYPREQLRAYALEHRLQWIDDPSNSDTRFARNYLRHAVMPHLQQRWPAASTTLSRSAQHSAEAAELLEALARIDMKKALHPNLHHSGGDALSIVELLQLTPARQRNVLRFWIEQAQLPLPQQRHLEHIQSDVLHAEADAEPCVMWPGAEVRRYRDALVAMPPLPQFDLAQVWLWDLATPLHVNGVGTLQARRNLATGLRAEACAVGVRVAFRSGGERIQPAGQEHHRSLKNLFQAAGVPPWQRDRVPLIFIGQVLAAVTGYWYAEEFAARPGETSIAINIAAAL